MPDIITLGDALGNHVNEFYTRANCFNFSQLIKDKLIGKFRNGWTLVWMRKNS